jgi:hypothetical protein
VKPAKTLRIGEVVTDPGLYTGVPIDRYHSGTLCDGPSVSSSGLRTIFKESPAHFWATSPLNPDAIEEPDSDAFVLGRAAHHLLLGEDAFSLIYVMRPPRFDSWRTDAAKAWRAEQEAEGRTVLLPSQIEAIRGMARSLAKHPLVANGLLNGEIEQSLLWKDAQTGVWLKSRPDAIPNWSGDFCDLKTCDSVKTEAIERAVATFGYHCQAALIGEASDVVLGQPMTSFSLVFVESKPPHCCRVVTLKDDDITRGRKQNHAALRIFARCWERGEWPGPGGADAEYLGIPSWEQHKIDERLELIEKEFA